MSKDTSNTTTFERLATLEEQSGSFSDRLDKFEDKLDRANNALSEIKTSLAQHSLCPRPGMCVDLSNDVVTMESRVRDLENLREQQKGAWKMLAGLSAAVATAGGAIGALINHWFQHPTPKP